jgi:hypothetical protein
LLSKLRTNAPLPVALLALFFAVGGASFASDATRSAVKLITGKSVKNSSLTGKDIRNNSVTGSDVKGIKSGDVTDGSLLSRDFKPGQLPAGQQGPKGDKGDSATKLFAYIRDLGPSDTATVHYGSGVTGVTDPSGDSPYTVSFNRSLENCVVQAVPGAGDPPGNSLTLPNAIPSVAVDSGNANETEVEFERGNPAAVVDTSFMITAFC